MSASPSILQMGPNGTVDKVEGLEYLSDGLDNTVVLYDNVDWEAVGESKAMSLLHETFATSKGSAIATLRMFESAINGFSVKSPAVAERLSAALEVRFEVLLAKHLEGVNMSASEYRNHSAPFDADVAEHLSAFALCRYQSVIAEFPDAAGQVVSLTIHHLTASPARVRDQIAAMSTR